MYSPYILRSVCLTHVTCFWLKEKGRSEATPIFQILIYLISYIISIASHFGLCRGPARSKWQTLALN